MCLHWIWRIILTGKLGGCCIILPWFVLEWRIFLLIPLFYDDCQIVHWRNHLKFPEDAKISPDAKDLICRLLCDVEHRLGSGGADQIKARSPLTHPHACPHNYPILFFLLKPRYLVLLMLLPSTSLQAHPWFKDIEWDKLYEMDAAFKPEVNSELDTQNFLKFDEVWWFSWSIH